MLRPQAQAQAQAQADGDDEDDPDGGFLLGAITVSAAHGLHVRPAARLVGEIADHGVRAELRNRTRTSAWVSAASLTEVMTLDARHGDELELRVWGPQAGKVLGAVADLAERDFHCVPAPPRCAAAADAVGWKHEHQT
jgi:phosphotransferase system HPr (HPr) family protein